MQEAMPNLLVVGNYPDQHFVSADHIFTFHQIDALKQNFDEVFVIAPTPWFPGFLAPFSGLHPKLRQPLAKRDYQYDNVRVFFPKYKPWAGRLPFPARFEALWPGVKRTVERHRFSFDLVHAHMTMFAPYGIALAREASVPVVLTVHDNHDWLVTRIREGEPQTARVLREADRLIRVNPLDVDEIRTVTGADKPIATIPNGFDPRLLPAESRAELRRALGLPADRFVFTSVARWVERKDPLILIDALARFDPSERPLLLLVGQDLMRGRIQQRIRELGLDDDVRVLGELPPREVLRAMTAADAVLLFSHSEGNPTVMFEALGCGRPYIGSDVGGVRTVLEDERLGLYGPPHDVEGVATLMRRAAATNWDEAFIREHAERYTWQSIARRIQTEVYEPALAAHSVG
jgi:teichuronic acid biosynthesis glycosyltransferase TuaC